jgi:hypothetical protein
MKKIRCERWEVGAERFHRAKDARRLAKRTGQAMVRLWHFHYKVSQRWPRRVRKRSMLKLVVSDWLISEWNAG